MRFLIDAQLSPALVNYLRSKGHEAEHVADVLGATAKDIKVVERAQALGAIIVSKDSDFVGLLEGMASAPPLLRVRVGNSTNRGLIQRLDLNWSQVEGELLNSKPIVELE